MKNNLENSFRVNYWDNNAGFSGLFSALTAASVGMITFAAGFALPGVAAMTLGSSVLSYGVVRVFREVMDVLTRDKKEFKERLLDLIGEKATHEHEASGLFKDKKELKEKIFEVVGNRRTQENEPTGLQADIDELKSLLIRLVGHDADDEHDQATGLMRDKKEILDRIEAIIGQPEDEDNRATGLNATLTKINGLIDYNEEDYEEEEEVPTTVRGLLEKVDVVADRLSGGAPLTFSLGGGHQQAQASPKQGGGKKKRISRK